MQFIEGNTDITNAIEMYKEKFPKLMFVVSSPEDFPDIILNKFYKDNEDKITPEEYIFLKKYRDLIDNIEKYADYLKKINISLLLIPMCDDEILPVIFINISNINLWKQRKYCGFTEKNIDECILEMLKHEIGHYIDWTINPKEFNEYEDTNNTELPDNLIFILENTDFSAGMKEQIANDMGCVDVDKIIFYGDILDEVNARFMIDKSFELIEATDENIEKIYEFCSNKLENLIIFSNCIYKVLQFKNFSEHWTDDEILDYIINNLEVLAKMSLAKCRKTKAKMKIDYFS